MKTKGTHSYYVYILTNKNKTVLYAGVTNNLKERLSFHQNPEPFSKAFTWFIMSIFLKLKRLLKEKNKLKGGVGKRKRTLLQILTLSGPF
ncbi:GIY-YIG nuclease family protein [Tamlana sp. 2201CG12-4]|uniref:GIY-YIG nuclease family protein n=1 Tax=Tamlana sp. 2201CG12-4 TaxID=3112582 RepID=UPI002DB917C4|nr:GIY-YIG nuclease family protein [Tamlana sp. 2201CG12-4]MEC3906363.1 GIY-YIG nuclease family protein [Tamlana sp. 2201CG12-4]